MSDTTETAAPTADTPVDDAAKSAETAAPEAAQPAEKTPEAEAAPAVAEPDEKPKKEPWWDKRIAQLTAGKASAEQRLAEARAQIAALQPVHQPEADAPVTRADFERAVRAEAERVAQQRETATKTNAFVNAGNAEYTPAEFNAKCNVVASLGATERPEFMAIITDMDAGHKVVAHLGEHPDLAQRIIDLPPLRMARELAKIEAEVMAAPAAKPVSKAPAPIAPVNGRGASEPSLDDPNLPIEKWVELRNKQIAAKQGRR